MKTGPKNPRPDTHQFVDLVSTMLELPPAHRVLSLRTGGGRAVQLAHGSGGPLTLSLEGAWAAGEEERACQNP